MAAGERVLRVAMPLVTTAIIAALVAELMSVRGKWAWLLIAATWICGALTAAAAQRMSQADLGLITPHWKTDLRVFLLSAAIIFPLLFLGVWFAVRLGLTPPLLPSHGRRWTSWILFQFIYVAAPEELFFRGYVQGSLRISLKSLAPGRPRLWDSIALTAVALLFAGAHVVVFSSAVQAWVFFPALIFGWLRARTGGVWAPMLFHGCANVAYAAAGALAYVAA